MIQDTAEDQTSEADKRNNADLDDNEEFVEVDPSNRFGRCSDLLGKGAVKKVYRGFDKDEGIEVAWNQASLSSLEQIQSEVHHLRTLHHHNIIKIYKFWVDRKNGTINFITELCEDDLMNYRRKHKHVCLKAIKDWARQILEALAYLHGRTPRVIHRDLKCANIFVNGHNGQIKIGDFGFSTSLDLLVETEGLTNIVGTPEFMAPEMFTQQRYDELVDIYAFGGCMIELLTLEMPYEECKNVVQIYKAVTGGKLPKALQKVKDAEAAKFIERCLAPVSARPSAVELLSDPFLQFQEPRAAVFRSPSSTTLSNVCLPAPPEGGGKKAISCSASSVRFICQKELEIKGEWEGASTVSMSLRISYPTEFRRAASKVNFPFDPVADTAEGVAEEMVEELHFPVSETVVISEMISSVLNTLRHNKEDALLREALDLQFDYCGGAGYSYLPVALISRAELAS